MYSFEVNPGAYEVVRGLTEKIQELSKKYSGVLQGGDITKSNITNDIKSLEEEYEKIAGSNQAWIGSRIYKRARAYYKKIIPIPLNNPELEIRNRIYKRVKAYYKIINDNYMVRKMLSEIKYI